VQQGNVERPFGMALLELGNRANVEVGRTRGLLLMSLLNCQMFDRHSVINFARNRADD
jgi:hypothetical protein